MARALLGHVGSPGEQVLAVEVARLRRRVAELESELAHAREADAAIEGIDHELHHLTASELTASELTASELAAAELAPAAGEPALA